MVIILGNFKNSIRGVIILGNVVFNLGMELQLPEMKVSKTSNCFRGSIWFRQKRFLTVSWNWNNPNYLLYNSERTVFLELNLFKTIYYLRGGINQGNVELQFYFLELNLSKTIYCFPSRCFSLLFRVTQPPLTVSDQFWWLVVPSQFPPSQSFKFW